MPRFLALGALLLISVFARAEDRWIELRSGPFQVLSNAGDRSGREILNELEQLRYLLGTALGNPGLKTTWPVRILALKSGRATPLALSRNTYTGSVAANAPLPRDWLRQCLEMLIQANAGRMPAGIEAGLADFYSTAEASGPEVTLGRPLPAAGRTLDWARIHLLEIDPNYSGKLRVLLYNLQHGADPEAAFRNAFGKTPAEIDRLAAAYFAAGAFPTAIVSGRPIDPRRDLFVRPAEPPLPQIALADLEFVQGDGRAAYEALLKTAPAEAQEGLGFVALREGRTADARREFTSSFDGGSQSARVSFEYARLEPEKIKAIAALEKAIALNPNWAEPHALFAALVLNPAKKLQELEAAARLDPRNASRWRALAEADMAQNKHPEAAKAWTAAEKAAASDAERDEIRAADQDFTDRRLEFEAAERKRAEEERQRNLQRIKDAALAEIHAAEERANRGQPAPPPGRKLEAWWDGPAPSGKLQGRLVQVDCLGGVTRLVIESPGRKLTRLTIHDPGKVVVVSGGKLSLGCGVARSPREVAIEYFPNSDAKLGAAGEVATIDYLSPGQPAGQPASK